MLGQIDIDVQGGYNGVVNQPLGTVLTATMVSGNRHEEFSGEYEATTSLLNTRGQAVNHLLSGTITVQGRQLGNRTAWMFVWRDLTVSEKGDYLIEVTIWEKPAPAPANPMPCRMGSAVPNWNTTII